MSEYVRIVRQNWSKMTCRLSPNLTIDSSWPAESFCCTFKDYFCPYLHFHVFLFSNNFDLCKLSVFICKILLIQNKIGSDPYKYDESNWWLDGAINNNYFLNWISALVKEMGGNLFRNYEFDFSRVFWVRSSEKHKKYVWFSNEVRKSHAFLCFSRDLTQNTREKSNSSWD